MNAFKDIPCLFAFLLRITEHSHKRFDYGGGVGCGVARVYKVMIGTGRCRGLCTNDEKSFIWKLTFHTPPSRAAIHIKAPIIQMEPNETERTTE